MSVIKKPLMMDDTGRAIVEALTQKEMTQTRIAEINAAADTAKADITAKTDEQSARIPEVTALAADVGSLKNDLDKYENKTVKYEDANLFIIDTAVKGYFISESDNVIIEKANSSFAYNKLSVKSGETYTVTRTDYTVYFADDNANIINKLNGSASSISPYTFTVPNKSAITTAYISFRTAQAPIEEFMIVKGETLPSKYIKNGYTANGDYIQFLKTQFTADGKEIYHVGADKQFTSITDCIISLQGNENEKIIYIDAGVYDIFEEIGGTDFMQEVANGISDGSISNWIDCSIIIPNNTAIIGIGNVILEFLPNAEDVPLNVSKLVSPINIMGNVEMENITIIADRCRYGIHDDGSSDITYAKAVKKYKNVHVIKGRSDNYGYEQAFGCGAFNGMQLFFENCIFEGDMLPFSIHNNSTINDTDGYKAVISNCAFRVTDTTQPCVRFGNIDWRTHREDVSMFNCSLNSNVKIYNETSYGIQNVDLKMVKCSDVEVTVQLKDGDTNNYPPSIYN